MRITTSKGTVQVQEAGTSTVNMGIRTSKSTVQVQEVGTWYSKYGDKNE